MRNIVLTIVVILAVMAGLAMAVATGALADDAAQCKQLGYKPGTAPFLQCLTLYQRFEALQAGAQQARGCAPGRYSGLKTTPNAEACRNLMKFLGRSAGPSSLADGTGEAA